MNRIIIFLLVLVMIGCIGINQSFGNEQLDDKQIIQSYCYGKTYHLNLLLANATSGSRYLLNMLHKDVDDFVPLLFAQSKMENLSIILAFTLVEMTQSGKRSEVGEETISLLERYIGFLKYDLIKTSLFEGMTKDHENQELMKHVRQSIYKSYNLLVNMKEELVDMRS